MFNSITRLNNGLRLVHQKIEGVRSVAICVLTRAGSINEDFENNGISHYIEHMMFKGTEKRSSFEIVKEIAGLGAQVNAFTSKENTCYYIVTVDDYVDECMEILSDLYFNSKFDSEEMEREKGVVLEEIAMSIDTPDDLCLENLNTKYYEGHSLGKTILGPSENIKKFKRKDIKTYLKENYRADNSVVCLVGNIELDKAKDLAEKYFAKNYSASEKQNIILPEHYSKNGEVIVEKDLEQANIAFDFPSYRFGHEKEMAGMVFNTIFGSGMSSRLFQEVREKLGLCYSIYSYPSAYSCTGDFCIYLGTNTDTSKKAIEVVRDEIKNVVKNGLTLEEIERGKRQLKGAYVLSQESTSSIMRVASRSALLLDKPFDLNEKVSKIDSVTIDDIKEVIEYIFDFERVVASYVGKAISYSPLEIMKG